MLEPPVHGSEGSRRTMLPIGCHDFGPRLSADAPSAYLQAQLHGNEVQGQVVLQELVAELTELPDRAFLGSVRVVPLANPIAARQYLNGCNGMYDVVTGHNWNRIFEWRDPELLMKVQRYQAAEMGALSPSEQLKLCLLRLSLGYELVVDVHTPDFGCEHLYCLRYDEGLPRFSIENIVEYEELTLPSFDQAQIALGVATARSPGVTSLTIELDSTRALTRAAVTGWAARLKAGLVEVGVLDPGLCPPASTRAPAEQPRRGAMRDYLAPATGPFVVTAPLDRRVARGEELMRVHPHEAARTMRCIAADGPCVPLCWRRSTVVVEGQWAVRVLEGPEI